MSELFSESLQTAVATQEEYRLPSIFEILAQDNLRASVRPAFEYLVKVLANHHPEYFGSFLAWYDELFTAAELLIQHHFLQAHIASYAEMYYGLRRKIKGLKVQSHSQLDDRRHYCSLFTLCLFPYIEIKLKKMHEKILEQREQLGDSCNLTFFGWIFYWMYPYLASSWEFWKLYLQFKFAIHENKYPDPFLKMLKIKLVVEDPTVVSQGSGNVFSRIFTRIMSGGVHAGVFVLQFVDWWYDDENQETVQKLTQNPMPPAPTEDIADTLTPVADNTTCPLCKRKRTNDTTISTSGYVFCYVCIYKYIKSNGKCPVTGYPTNLEHLIKLYLPE